MGKLTTLFFLVLSFSQSGCYNDLHINPSEIKYLNRPNGKVYVESTSGRKINAYLNNDMIVTLTSGYRYTFKAPYECTLQPNGKLVDITSRNRPTISFNVDNIRSLIVKHPSGWYELAYGASLIGGLLLSVVLLGAVAAI